MSLRLSLTLGGLVLLCLLIIHIRRNPRTSAGIVLSTAVLTVQAVLHQPSPQLLAEQLDDEAEDDAPGEDPPSLEAQIRRQARLLRSGEPLPRLTLRLPPGWHR